VVLEDVADRVADWCQKINNLQDLNSYKMWSRKITSAKNISRVPRELSTERWLPCRVDVDCGKM